MSYAALPLAMGELYLDLASKIQASFAKWNTTVKETHIFFFLISSFFSFLLIYFNRFRSCQESLSRINIFHNYTVYIYFNFFCLFVCFFHILLCPTLTYLPARGLAPGGLHLNISFYNYTMKRLRLVRCEREPMIIV